MGRSDIFTIFFCLQLSCLWQMNPTAAAAAATAPELEVTSKLVGDQKLANKIEKLLAVKGHPKIDLVKEEMGNQIGYNLLKILSTTVSGLTVQSEKQKVLKLMRQISNDELDFIPVVEKIPFLLRKNKNETEKLELVLKAVGVKGTKDSARQGEEEAEVAESDGDTETEVGAAKAAPVAAVAAAAAVTPASNVSTTTPSQINRILDAASKININEISSFLKEIPEIFEGIQTIVDGVDEFFE